ETDEVAEAADAEAVDESLVAEGPADLAAPAAPEPADATAAAEAPQPAAEDRAEPHPDDIHAAAAFEGLILGAGKSTDVFATSSPPAPADPFGGVNLPDDLRIPPARESKKKGQPRPRRGGPAPAIDWPSDRPQLDPALPRTGGRRRFGVPALLVLMILSLVTAAAAIWLLMPPKFQIQASLILRNLEERSIHDQNRWLEVQRVLLFDDNTRKSALAWLKERHKDVSPGFLGDAPSFQVMNLQTRLGGQPRNALMLSFDSRDRRGDPLRMQAVLAALFAHPDNLRHHEEVEKLRTEI